MSETRTKRKKKRTKRRKKWKTMKKNRRKKKRNIVTTKSKRKGSPWSSFMPLPLNFSVKNPGNEVSSNSGLKSLVLV